MKKIDTVQTYGKEILKEQKLTMGIGALTLTGLLIKGVRPAARFSAEMLFDTGEISCAFQISRVD
jgi:hypothetical protein